jgi:hypothetical protein
VRINRNYAIEKCRFRKIGPIEITAFFAMEADLTKKRGRGRPRGSTNANITRRRINLRRAQYAVQREIDRTITLNSLGILRETLAHFYWRARILETLGGEGDYDLLDRAWAECGRWAEKLAQFEHPKIQAVRLAQDPNAALLPEHMSLEQLRDSIMEDLARLRERGVLDLSSLSLANPKADLPMNGGSPDQAE